MKMLSENPAFQWSANNLLQLKFLYLKILQKISIYEFDKILVFRNKKWQLSLRIHLFNLVKILVQLEIKLKQFLSGKEIVLQQCKVIQDLTNHHKNNQILNKQMEWDLLIYTKMKQIKLIFENYLFTLQQRFY
ncbi:unnamed protein product [Paramecium sonneborni]|uniref:Uncharacterized protein n=1 Tax=Paramecium sonneborni TaxID=65129 RepID=A0A8S1P7R6_9CILI|nr:unnamed protein product [Paramecium sonneborni]